MKKALIVVDMQYDFMEGGSLAVPNANEIIPEINELLTQHELVIFTRDFHPADHKSFASHYTIEKEYDHIQLNGVDQVLWPDHCVQRTRGSHIHEDIDMSLCKGDFYIFKKGMNPEADSYSAFYDAAGCSTGLSEFLDSKDVNSVLVVGLAGDYCVKYTACDANKDGFATTMKTSAIRNIQEWSPLQLDEFWDKGITII
jgi:nicotinamidase/pyrazinamidase